MRACSACGFSNEPAARFCGGCGAPIAQPAAPSGAGGVRAPQQYTPSHLAERILDERRALEGERKQVTVLFADLKGSMELLADRDPEESRRLLDPILELMMSSVHQYEGTVNQVLGDGIMALFGAPVGHEDHAVRAGYAALRMQQAIAAHAERIRPVHAIDVQIRVGLNSGEVVVRGIGNDLTMDYSAVGQTTHLAARMEQLATPGTILATEAFARLTEGYLHFKPLGLMPIKGLAEPLDVLQLVDAEPTRTRFQAASTRGLTRFVGRETEIDVLRRALERARSGLGQVVAVAGEPGTGKSRLFYEFLDSGLTREWLKLETGAVSYGKVNAFSPVRDLLKGYFQIEERDDVRRVGERIERQTFELDQSIRGIVPALKSLLDVPVDDPAWEKLEPAQRRQRILDGVKRLLVRQSQVQPLLLSVENLHWVDAQTQALLDGLVESLPTARILLLVNYRSEYQHAWGNKIYYRHVRLDPLAPEGARELLRVLLGGGSDLDQLKELLIERTEGNPFFLEESVRTLVETKVLVGDRGNRSLARAPGAIQVPTTVQAILAARIDRLPAPEKRLLQSASVIGRDVTLPLLRAVAGLPEPELLQGLARLQGGEFLYETSLFPELEYTFKHALTQEVAYGSLVRERRQALHGRIVEAIETLYPEKGDQETERLAHHALQGELWAKAVMYYRRAGAKAAMRSAYREAVACFERALSGLERLPRTRETLEQAFDLRLELRPWLAPLAEYGRIFDNLRAAESAAEELGDSRRLGIVCAYMTDYYRLTGASEEAIACGERALEAATKLDDFGLKVLANMLLGHACHAVGDYRRAVELLRRNVESLSGPLVRERFGSAGLPSALSRSFMVFSLSDLGEFDEAVVMSREAISIAAEADTAHSQVLASHSLGLAYLCQGDLDRALPVLEETYARCQVGRIPLGARLLASALGYAHVLSGNVADALPLLEEAVRQAEQLKVFFRYALWLSWLGEANLRAGRLADASKLAERAAEHAIAHKEAGHHGYALRLLGQVRAMESPARVDAAERAFREALGIAERLEMRPLQGHCRLDLGTLYHRAGRPEEARAELSAAAELFGSLAMPFWRARAERDPSTL